MPLASDPLDSVRSKFYDLVQPFDVDPVYKRFATAATDDGGPHVEHRDGIYAYVLTERGNEYERRETSDPDELLYWLVSGTTGAAAQQFELANRIAGRDPRRLLFARHVELLEHIRADWGSRKREEYERVLKERPYRDRATSCWPWLLLVQVPAAVGIIWLASMLSGRADPGYMALGYLVAWCASVGGTLLSLVATLCFARSRCGGVGCLLAIAHALYLIVLLGLAALFMLAPRQSHHRPGPGF